jgi:hypothetical protein
MNRRAWPIAAKWIVGAVAYVAISVLTARLFVLGIQAWARIHSASLGDMLELSYSRRPVLLLCIVSGSIYASALARPAMFGGALRIWKHLACTYLLSVLGCAAFSRLMFLDYPNFQFQFLTNAYITCLFGIGIVSFLIAVASWVHLAFVGSGGVPKGREATVPTANLSASFED